jgi:hypothetical protein
MITYHIFVSYARQTKLSGVAAIYTFNRTFFLEDMATLDRVFAR